MTNIEILIKNRNFEQTSKFWLKIEILSKYRNFEQTSKFWANIEILRKHRNFEQTSKFWANIEILSKHPNFEQTSKFWLKNYNNSWNFSKSFVEILVKDQMFPKNRIIMETFQILLIIVYTVETYKSLIFFKNRFIRFFEFSSVFSKKVSQKGTKRND